MDTKTRADLVRACRDENKQERARQAQGFSVLDAAGRAQGRVQRWSARNRQRMQAQNQRSREVYGRIGAGIDRRVSAAADSYRAWDTANIRRRNVREAERIRTEGYDITPEFRRRSQNMRNEQQSVALRANAGTGVNRHRGALRDIRTDPNRVTEAQRTAAILRDRATRANRPRTRTIRGTVTYHDRRGPKTQVTRTERGERR